jgi:glycosyltransferase involved in cell wall biosynthesis
MKLGIDSRSINLHSGSGIGTYTKNLVLNLIENNSETFFELIWTGKEIKEFNRPNTELIHTSGRYGGFYENNYIPTILEENKVDLYHIPQNGIGFPFNWDLNVIVTIHDLIPYIMPETVGMGYLNRFLKEMPVIIESAKAIITVSEYSKKDILRFFPSFPSDRIYVTPLATNNNLIPISKDYCKNYMKTNLEVDDPYILYIGGFSLRKNVRELILSFASIEKDLKVPHKLLITGSLKDEGQSLKELVSSMGLKNKVIFTGYLDDSLLPILYSGSEAFVYPSLYEGFGLPPLEAMSCRTPVITSNLTSIPEVTADAAILIDPFNKDDLKEALLKVLNSSSIKEELSEKGYKKSLEFNWVKTAARTITAYKSILYDK